MSINKRNGVIFLKIKHENICSVDSASCLAKVLWYFLSLWLYGGALLTFQK
jgi:hypothetical protein